MLFGVYRLHERGLKYLTHLALPSRLPFCCYRSRPVNYIICGNHINIASYIIPPSKAFLIASLLLSKLPLISACVHI